MKLTMFGIPNCNTIKKAKDWLTAHNVEHHFHNYKKDGIDEATLQAWSNHVGWKTLLNQRGTTWKKLSVEDKSNLNQAKAIQLMSLYPSMIKRPVLQDLDSDMLLVGFEEEAYQAFLDSNKES